MIGKFAAVAATVVVGVVGGVIGVVGIVAIVAVVVVVAKDAVDCEWWQLDFVLTGAGFVLRAVLSGIEFVK